MTVEGNYTSAVLVVITTMSNWLKDFATALQPIRSKTESNHILQA